MIFKFGADGSQYSRTLNTMRSQTKKFSGSVKNLLKGAFAFAGFRGMKSIIDDMDRIQKLSKRFGMSAEDIQKFGFAAEQGGTTLEVLAKGLAQANRAAIEASNGLVTYQRAFDDLGISYEDFAAMDQAEQFYTIADAIKEAQDKNKALAASQTILGRAGLELIPTLKDGSQAIKDLVDDLKTFTDAEVDAAAALNDQVNAILQDLSATFGKWFVQVAQGWQILVAAGTQAARELKNVYGSLGKFILLALTNPAAAGMQAGMDFDTTKGAAGRIGDAAMAEYDRQQEEIRKADAERQAEREKQGEGAGAGDTDDPAKIAKIEDKIEKQKEKNDEVGIKDAEKLAKLNEKIAAGLEEYSSMESDPSTKTLDLKEKELELLKLQNEQLELQADLEKKAADEKEAKDKKEESNREAADEIREEIYNEQDKREESGLSKGALLALRKRELAQAEADWQEDSSAAWADGSRSEEERLDLNTKELDIEKRKSEIADMEASLADSNTVDPSTSIIASSLASIGGGGGVAAFSNDPLFNESKKQTTILEGIRRAIENNNPETNGVFENPEL